MHIAGATFTPTGVVMLFEDMWLMAEACISVIQYAYDIWSLSLSTLRQLFPNQPSVYFLQTCKCKVRELIMQVDLAAAGRAVIQRRAPPISEAAALPGGSPIFAAAADDGNKVLQEAAPISLLQVCDAVCPILHILSCLLCYVLSLLLPSALL